MGPVTAPPEILVTCTFATSPAPTAAVTASQELWGKLSATLPASYTYAVPDAFDFNGDWIAHALQNDDYGIDMRFTIRNDVLVSLSCGTSEPLRLSAPLQIVHGLFSAAGDDGLSFSGSIDSAETSEGRTNAAGCGDGYWWADKAELSR